MTGNSAKYFTNALEHVLARFCRSSIPRVLFVKQHFDIFGPSRSINFLVDGPWKMLNAFAYKATYWEMACLLRADWLLIKSEKESVYRTYVKSFPHIERLIAYQERNALDLSSVDFASYDIVISLEPFLECSSRSDGPVFFYFMNEHSNLDYENQFESLAAGYTSFLDHM